jgi:UDP-3-O-[3-hydroxymyristoyl] glucosamine N-acyltransferase
MTLAELAERLQCKLIGNPETIITGLAPIEEAGPKQLTFLANKKYQRYLASTRAAAIIIDPSIQLPPHLSGLISDTPYLTFAQALAIFFSPPIYERRIHPQAAISPSATLGQDVSIGPFTTIGDQVRIGDHVTILSHCAIYPRAEIGDYAFIHSHCVIREGCQLGKYTILQNGAIIGSDGFGYAKQADRRWFKIPQTGRVIIEDEVEIGANTAIDRATIGVTHIGRGTKIDNLVQVGHSSTIGEDTLLCAQVGLAGSTHVGNQVILSGQVGVAGHLHIGDRVIATAQSGIPNSVPADSIVSGYPAIANRTWLKASALFAQLPQISKELRQLRTQIAELKSQIRNQMEPPL